MEDNTPISSHWSRCDLYNKEEDAVERKSGGCVVISIRFYLLLDGRERERWQSIATKDGGNYIYSHII